LNEVNERLLIEAAQKDPGCFGELYERNFHRVYAFIIRRVRNRQQAQDLTSEVFQQALASLPRFEWRGAPFAAWLYRIASNAVADHVQKISREIAAVFDDPVEQPDVERRAMLFGLVEKLPNEQQRVLHLRFTEGRSIREIAEQIGKSEGAVKQLQWRALQKLRADMHV